MFRTKVEELRKVFNFGSWRKNAGRFLGMNLGRRKDGSIRYGDSEFVEQLRPIAISKGARMDEAASDR